MQRGIGGLIETLDGNRMLLIIVAVLSLIASGAIAVFYVQRNLIRRLGSIGDAMRRLSAGTTELSVPAAKDGDELGEMARAVLVFRDRAIEKDRLESEAAEQRRSNAQTQARIAEEERMRTEEQAHVVHALNFGLGKLSEGDLTFHLNDEFPHAYVEIKDGFNSTISRLRETIQVLAESTHEVSHA